MVLARSVLGRVECITMSSTATLQRGRHGSFAASTSFKGHKIEKQADGSAIVRDVEVFRVGSFRNSWGEPTTWEDLQLQQIVDNYHALVANGAFPDVPVRENHSRDVKSLMGYFADLRKVDDKILADFHITEPEPLAKIERKTYRSVSFEIGPYVTNDEVEYWPVAWGCAYVDIPAVEHLHSKEAKTNASYFVRDDDQQEPSTMPDTQPPAPHVFSLGNNVTETDPNKVQAYINRLVAENTAQGTRLTTLEAFAKDVKGKARKEFVGKLAADKKILASQTEALEAFATSDTLTDEQFTAWAATFDKAPALPLLAEHGAGGGDGAGAPGNEARKKLEDELSIARGTVEFHRQGGMKQDAIEKTESYKNMVRLEAELAKQS